MDGSWLPSDFSHLRTALRHGGERDGGVTFFEIRDEGVTFRDGGVTFCGFLSWWREADRSFDRRFGAPQELLALAPVLRPILNRWSLPVGFLTALLASGIASPLFAALGCVLGSIEVRIVERVAVFEVEKPFAFEETLEPLLNEVQVLGTPACLDSDGLGGLCPVQIQVAVDFQQRAERPINALALTSKKLERRRWLVHAAVARIGVVDSLH